MATPQQIYDAIQSVHDQHSFVHNLLTGALGWPIPDGIDDIGDISYEWSSDELRADGLDDHLVDGRIYQIPKMTDDQPWGIFLLEFENEDVFLKNRGLIGPLRKVLRGLVQKRRGRADLPSWNRDNLLFICTDTCYRHYRFGHFDAPAGNGKNPPLSMFGWNHGDCDIHTLCTHNLPYLEWDPDRPDYNKWRQAFDKQQLTEKFFSEYKAVFDNFQKDLCSQTQNALWAHDYALQFLNRCMFLYFIQRKKWLGDNGEFMNYFWETYKQSNQPADTFFENWLKVLFFEAFNAKYSVRRPYMPDSIHNILLMAPYLNGGLFRENELDAPGFDFSVSDGRFSEILKLLERYNFTVSESTPLDIEVAVDAEMLGMVYETLVNIAEAEDRRGDAGIFYTPRVEVDMMCRLSVVNYLSNCLGTQHRELFYKWLCAFSSDKERIAEKGILEKRLLEPLRAALESLTVVDPACGSGAFLVGMLMVLDNLFDRLDKLEGKSRSIYDRRKDIIGRSLYGVDIKDWACHVAELRLWLALVIDADFTELHIRKEPLLPNFTFNIRCGDSLVQAVGGVDLAHRKEIGDLTSGTRKKLNEIKNEKIRFYNNDPARKYRTADEIFQQELAVFRELLTERIQKIQNGIAECKRQIAQSEAAASGGMFADDDIDRDRQKQKQQKQITEYKERIASLEEQLSQAERIRNTLERKQDIPFVWDISFAEIFSDDKQGFDILIGNPPYVRQEKIADPRLRPDQITAENKKAYKAKLQRVVYRAWPRWFGYNEATDRPVRALDAKSDLYIYFFFYGLSLLNDKGTFCFVTSNSWLDVGYGKNLQEFLLNCCSVRMIIDNKAMRSFKSADVNTAIVLLNAPADKPTPTALNHMARFVMFYVPFEQAMDDVVFTLIDTVQHRTKTEQFRVFPVRQEILLAEGCGLDDDDEEDPKPAKKVKGPLIKTEKKYLGNKWGGKYLRAPDIYWTILEKGKGKLVRLGDIAEVRRGVTTGANEFFYLDQQKIDQWGIEEEFLKPVIKSPRECKSIVIDPKNLRFKLFMCHKSKSELEGTAALEYIKWGEKENFHNRSSCKGRSKWWGLQQSKFNMMWQVNVRDRLVNPILPPDVFVDKMFYLINTPNHLNEVALFLNSSLAWLFLEINGLIMMGQSTLAVYMLEDLQNSLIVQPDLFKIELSNFFYREILKFREELKQKDRKELEYVLFDCLNLTNSEREAVYEAVIDLVEARLRKASSLEK
jgi:type I restriction-modification system DNA methylase subunit